MYYWLSRCIFRLRTKCDILPRVFNHQEMLQFAVQSFRNQLPSKRGRKLLRIWQCGRHLALHLAQVSLDLFQILYPSPSFSNSFVSWSTDFARKINAQQKNKKKRTQNFFKSFSAVDRNDEKLNKINVETIVVLLTDPACNCK